MTSEQGAAPQPPPIQPDDWMTYFMQMMQKYGPVPSTFAPGAELSALGPQAGKGPGFFNPLLSSGAHSNTSQGGAYEKAHGRLSSPSQATMG